MTIRYLRVFPGGGKMSLIFGVIGFLIVSTTVLIPLSFGRTFGVRACAVPFLLWGVWSLMPTGRLPTCMQGLSFLIYVTHAFWIRVIEVVFHLSVDNVFAYALKAILAVVLTVFGAMAVRCCFPKSCSFLCGGR